MRIVSRRPGVPDHLRLRRKAERGVYDRAAIDAILDEALYCHVGFVADGRPLVIPTLHARVGDRLYLHGSSANRMLRAAAAGAPVCVTATLLDGLVIAKSVFHHSVTVQTARYGYGILARRIGSDESWIGPRAETVVARHIFRRD